MENEENKEKKQKMRSRLYPRYDLEEAVSFIKVVNKLGGKNVSTKAVAVESGKSVTNSTFIGRVSSAKQFGLLNQEKGKISLTELGSEIIFPRDENNKESLLKRAFASSSFYKELINDFSGKTLPDQATLSNRLFHDYKIEAGAKDKAARNFVHSAEYAGVIQNGILAVYEDEEHSETSPIPKQAQSIVSMSKQQESSGNDSDFVFDFKGGIRLVIPRTPKTNEAIMDGELKEIKTGLKDFAEKYGEAESEEEVVTEE